MHRRSSSTCSAMRWPERPTTNPSRRYFGWAWLCSAHSPWSGRRSMSRCRRCWIASFRSTAACSRTRWPTSGALWTSFLNWKRTTARIDWRFTVWLSRWSACCPRRSICYAIRAFPSSDTLSWIRRWSSSSSPIMCTRSRYCCLPCKIFVLHRIHSGFQNHLILT